eukprot:3913082-Prymnesium_polylepis.1
MLRASGPALVVGDINHPEGAGAPPIMPADLQVLTERDEAPHEASALLIARILLPVPGTYLVEVLKLYDDLNEHATDTTEVQRTCHSADFHKPYFLGRIFVAPPGAAAWPPGAGAASVMLPSKDGAVSYTHLRAHETLMNL